MVSRVSCHADILWPGWVTPPYHSLPGQPHLESSLYFESTFRGPENDLSQGRGLKGSPRSAELWSLQHLTNVCCTWNRKYKVWSWLTAGYWKLAGSVENPKTSQSVPVGFIDEEERAGMGRGYLIVLLSIQSGVCLIQLQVFLTHTPPHTHISEEEGPSSLMPTGTQAEKKEGRKERRGPEGKRRRKEEFHCRQMGNCKHVGT